MDSDYEVDREGIIALTDALRDSSVTELNLLHNNLDEEALQSAPTDEEIHSIFDFPEANTAEIKIVASANVTGTETKAILGDTFAWKDILKEEGFSWDKPTEMWHAPTGTDVPEQRMPGMDYATTSSRIVSISLMLSKSFSAQYPTLEKKSSAQHYRQPDRLRRCPNLFLAQSNV